MRSTENSGTDCPHAWELMPWVLQDSASQEQAAWLENHLAGCAPCRAEFAQQSRLRLALSLPHDLSFNVEAGLKRLLVRLDASDPLKTPRQPRPRAWLVRALAAAVFAQAVGLGVLGVKLAAVENPPYRTLSETPPPAPPGAIHVVPDAGMTLADWNALLRALHLQVVHGPNSVGAYTVVPADAATAGQILPKLRAARGIRLAEPVSAAAP
ncbi:zf-HC2 domain-containing protein [Frateuria sp.]|uniref:zf-HC2 domain-containing protein n=1 Tax=Frateuria sp. TaxID=2211372 RepID=UPI0017C4C243|nr:zf-HC2 domain-containing protein [Frateuria sp.]NUR21600.1 zf-HC2 domain-containing protein [Frateuria sp.]